MSYYDELGVNPTASTTDIKIAYKAKLLDTHPDKKFSKDGSTQGSISSLKEAYRVLVDERLRQQYDIDLKKSVQKQGFNLNGDGLDIYSLEEFDVIDSDDVLLWTKDCPRCTAPESMILTEKNLEENGTDDGEGGFDIIVQCGSCSLWIKVKYAVEEE